MDLGVDIDGFAILTGLAGLRHELLLFAAFWIFIGLLDELAVDLGWLWLRCTGRAGNGTIPAGLEQAPLTGAVAVFVPAWQEGGVIRHMISHTLKVWPQQKLRIYVGCYPNDFATLAAAMSGAAQDHRVRLVVLPRPGPSTKADCLNRLYHALRADEERTGQRFSSVILQDAEDMVHPAALGLMDFALAGTDFVQLPVRPEPQHGSPWVAGHYSDEFTESHAKTMVFRDAIGAALPAAGVGCGFARRVLDHLYVQRLAEGQAGPFAAECLTEDYELGFLIARAGGKGRFLRLRDEKGQLVATRSYFPPQLEGSIRQKTRWIHGIAFQGWDRLGWKGSAVDIWMSIRDRRGPMTALVLAAGYLLIPIEAMLAAGRYAGWRDEHVTSPAMQMLLLACFGSLFWRLIWRFGFTAREYGWREGLRGVLRMPVGNLISILAGARALMAYVRSLRGEKIVWDKTEHTVHPSQNLLRGVET